MSQLTNYIRKELDKGFSQDLITKKLLQAGYDKKEISESFKSLKSAEPLLVRKTLDTIHSDVHVQWSKWVFPLLAILVVVFLGYLVYLYQGTSFVVPNEGEISPCINLTGGEKDLCMLQLAEQGVITCDSLSTQILQTICSDKMWETHKCDYEFILSKNTTAREDCLLQEAIATQDVSYCERKINDKATCFFQIAQAAQDPSLCSHSTECYNQYAIFSQDISVCDFNTEDFEKEQCKENYTNNINTSNN